MKKATFLLTCVLLTAMSFSCRTGNRDSDEQYMDTRELDGVTRLKINGVFNLSLSQGDDESLTIEGSPELAEKLEVIQSGNLLELKMEEFSGGIFQNKELKVTLVVSDLEEFAFEGVGNIKSTTPIEVQDIQLRGKGVGNIELELITENVDAEFNLMGNMVLKGKSNQVRLVNEGIGNIAASGFITQNMDLRSSGIGRVAVHCEGELAIEVNGIGAVEYSGNPTITKEKIDGIGKVYKQ